MVEVISSDVGVSPMFPEFLNTIRPEQEIAFVTGDGDYGVRKHHDGIAERVCGCHNSAAQERHAVEGMMAPVQPRVSRTCGHRNTPAARSCDDGADITAGGAQ